MKFQLFSDIHAEFGHDFVPAWDGESSYLLLAGDIGLCSQYSAYKEFLLKCTTQGWEKVFIIAGNHESYGQVFQKSIEMMNNVEEDTGVIFLNNTCVPLGSDLVLIGGTMWTDLSSPVAGNAAQFNINDYRKIKWFDGKNYFRINAQITTKMHFQFRDFLTKTLDSLESETRAIVMTHTAPHITSSLEYYKCDALTMAYYTDMSSFFGPKVLTWVHGHMHNSSDYTIKGTRVLANPHGYYGFGYDERNPEFDKKGIGFEA